MCSIPRNIKPYGPHLAALILVIVGVWRVPAPETRLGFTLLMETGVLLALALWVGRVNVWWGLFVALALFSSFYPVYSRFSFLALYGVVMAALWYLMLTRWVDPDATRHLMDALCVLVLFHVLFQILQLFNMDPLLIHSNPDAQQAVGLMANRNEVSALLAFSVPAFLRPKWCWGLIPVALGLILARTMGGMVAAAGGLLFYNVMQGRVYLSLALAVMAVLVYAWLIDGAGLERLAVWKIGLKTGQQHWLFGSGIGHWKVVFNAPMVNGSRWSTAHNEFIQGVFEMGVPFVLVVTGYLRHVIRRYSRAALVPATALVIIGINSLVHFPFHIAVTAMVAVTWMGILDIHLGDSPDGIGTGIKLKA